MSFQIPSTTTAAATGGGFSFGLSTTADSTKPPTFSFGVAPTATTKPTFGVPAVAAAPTTTPVAGFGGFGTTPAAPPTATTTPAPTFGLPAAAASATSTAPASTASNLPTLTGFGEATAAAVPAFGVAATPAPAFGAATATSSATPTFTLGTPVAASTAAKPALPQLTGFGTATAPAAAPTTTTTAAAPATSGFALPKATTTTAAAPLLGLGGAAASSTAATTAAAPTATGGGGFANLTTATKTTDSAAVASASQMTFNQLEEHINKWTLELEDQEKVFTEQATQINAWDKVLIGNNQKILELNDAVQKVKNDQQMLEQELEFIATQHNELEESIAPLQKEFAKMPQVDVERSQTYLMVENLDTQLKQMSEDLKEIIDNLNEANKGQDNTDPIIQIGKILNAHMSSLQWIETSSANIRNKLDDIEKMHESFKRDSERSFRSAYYN